MKPIFDIYTIVNNYVVNEFHSIDSSILIELIKDSDVAITHGLASIPFIHSGYLSIILPKDISNGRSDKEFNTET